MTSGVPIRLASAADASDIAAMSRVYIEQGLPWSWTPRRIGAAIRSPTINVAVARDRLGLVGFGIMEYADAVAHLLLLAVRADRRRLGFGEALVDWLEKVARTAGIAAIRVEARSDNEAALGLYRKRGYSERGSFPGMYFGIEDGVRLEKRLTACGTA